MQTKDACLSASNLKKRRKQKKRLVRRDFTEMSCKCRKCLICCRQFSNGGNLQSNLGKQREMEKYAL